MKATRRRTRKTDPLASRAAVQGVIQKLRASLPNLIPKSDKELLSLLRATLYAERHPDIRTKRGRKAIWKDYELIKTASALRTILRETKAVSVRSFVEHYLLIPSFPQDVAEALERGEINLFEAEQLARLVSSRTGIREEKMKKRRRAMLQTHIQSGESGARLKARIDALLHLYKNPEDTAEPSAEAARFSPEVLAAAAQLEAELEADRQDPDSLVAGIGPDHFFYEYLQIIVSYMREVRPEEISDQVMERVMTLSEQLIQQLNAIYKQQYPPADEATMEEAKKSFHI